MRDIIFKNGLICDGTGTAPMIGDVALKDGIITKIAAEISDEAAETIDISGHIISPGFIDIHSHSDASFLSDERCQSRIYQGVTSELAGQCGSTIYPCPKDRMQNIRDFSKNEDFDSDYFASSSLSEFIGKCEEKNMKMSTNLLSLIGHGALRAGVMGQSPKKASKEELDLMCALLDADMKNGAWGLSLGLGYTPGINADQEELNALGAVVAKYDGIVTSHMRDQGEKIYDALDEMYEINRSSGAKVHIVHLKLSDKSCWGGAPDLYENIQNAQKSGVAVTCDMYPYNAASSGITNVFPKWAIEGGTEMAAKHLRAKGGKCKEIMEYLENRYQTKEDGDSLYIVTTNGKYPEADGKTAWQVSQALGVSIAEAIAKVTVETDSHCRCIMFAMSNEDVMYLLSKDNIVIGSDGYALPLNPAENNGKPHPRSFSTFPKFLRLVRENNLCKIETAVNRITGQSAAILGLKNRGVLKEGYVADITVFTKDITDKNSFDNPFVKCDGIVHVVMEGKFALKNGEQTDNRLGKFIYKNR